MVNRKITMSAMSIVTAMALMSGATFAFFTDSASSTGNTFTSGNADLDIATDNSGTPGAFNESLVNAFNVANVAPGYDEVHRFWLENASASVIDLSMITDVSNYTAPSPEDEALASNLLISWRCDLDNGNDLADETYTPEFSVKTWFEGGNTSLGNIAHSDEMICEMRTRVLDSVGDDIANGSVDFDVMFDATQIP